MPAIDLTEFWRGYGFAPDDYQVEACGHLAAGRSVLVAAPTGAGKTVVGECACWLALRDGSKCFYTTPIKALSNQKYHDLVARHGVDAVGLLTGDVSVNGEAPIVVMTTEVLRNMAYASSPTLRGLGYVVMDEVHYLADRFRGAVWEEVILTLPPEVVLVALSATVSNAEEFGEWLQQARGGPQGAGVGVVVSERRPVPLDQHVAVGRDLLDLFDGEAVNPKLRQMAHLQSMQLRGNYKVSGRRPSGRSGPFGDPRMARRAGSPDRAHGPNLTPSRRGLVASMRRADLLPAIVFVFSRAGCDAAVRQLVGDGVVLTTPDERQALFEIAERHGATLGADDRAAIGWRWFVAALGDGIAAHHAGLLPVLKAVVEEGFAAGLVKVVFATETLALGINMPARSVVIEKLVKYNGETHADLTPGEYTQLTGRAGRRGIDTLGHAIVVWQAGMNPAAVAGLASRRTYPLRSSFAPTYNMTVNLLATRPRDRAIELLRGSFAQFQADRRRGRVFGDSLVQRFERLCDVLTRLGYLDGRGTLTQAGRLLTRVYAESDLVVTEALRGGVFEGLTVPELAAALSSVLYEARREGGGRAPSYAEAGLRRLRRVVVEVRSLERECGVAPSRVLDAGFAGAAFDWADGASLAEVLDESGLPAGDFVRWTRQVIDLAGQIAVAPGVTPSVAATARAVVAAMRRDIIDLDAADADD